VVIMFAAFVVREIDGLVLRARCMALMLRDDRKALMRAVFLKSILALVLLLLTSRLLNPGSRCACCV